MSERKIAFITKGETVYLEDFNPYSIIGTITNTLTVPEHRYEKESNQLAKLAITQLNLEKNKTKPDFESLSIHEIVDKMKEEFNEVLAEVCHYPIDYNLASNEIGDLGATLVGLIAKLNNMLKDPEYGIIKRGTL